jgi:hypothetical protein
MATPETTDPRSLLDPAGLAIVDETVAATTADRTRLAAIFPSLPRRIGRDRAGTGRVRLAGAEIDLAAFRRCDVGAAAVLRGAAATAAECADLYAHGDLEERTMLLRSLHLLPVGPLTVQLLGEVQRTNVVAHVEAAVADGDLLARAAGCHGFDQPASNRLLLKVAFLDLPLARLFGAERLANPELSRMLQDLATEREAAGRPVWRDTWRLIGRAPCPGSVARLLGGLEHGDDGVRLAAAEGLLALGRVDLVPFAAERLPREVRPVVRAALQQLTALR